MRLDHNDKAIPLLEHALRLSPADAESTYQLGVLYDLTPRANYPDPHYHLGRIAADRKDYKNALAELEHARCLLRIRRPFGCC